MVALCNRADHYIFALSFVLSSFFPRLISAVADWMSASAILPHMVWISANLECRAEMCCARLAGNAGPKNRQKFAIWAPSHNFVGLCLRKARIDNRKKFVKQQYLLYMSSQYGELRPTNGLDRFTSLGHPCKNFNGFRVLAALLHGTPVVGVIQTLRC